jgi:hypothetical protein
MTRISPIKKFYYSRAKLVHCGYPWKYEMTRQSSAVFLAVFLIFPFPKPLRIVPTQLEPPKISYAFGDYLKISGKIEAPINVRQSMVYIQIHDMSEPFSDHLTITPSGAYIYYYSIKSKPLRAFATITYWIEITNQLGEKKTSPPAILFYEDNRYKWRTLSSSLFSVNWYRGDEMFGKITLDVAEAGLKQARSLIALPQPDNISIYVYANAQELHQTMQLAGQSWVGAHADPDLNIILLSIPGGPEQRLEMERQIPHELIHILLYDKLGDAYSNLPMWLNEGLATMAEMDPNPDYLLLLENARKNNSFLTIGSLCNSFPSDPPSAYLAYAESGDFIRYLHHSYGSAQLTALVEAYRDNVDCAAGVEDVYNQTLDQLEADWRRESFGEVITANALNNILPWLLILITVLGVPTGLTLLIIRKKPHQTTKP